MSLKRFTIIYIRLLVIIFILGIFANKPIIFTVSMFIAVATYGLEVAKFKNNNDDDSDNSKGN